MKNGPTHEFPYNWPTFKERDELKGREKERDEFLYIKYILFIFFPLLLRRHIKLTDVINTTNFTTYLL